MTPAPLFRLDEALERLLARVHPVAGTEAVQLRQALGRVLARDVLAARDLPAADSAAMDGYALRGADLASSGETRLVLTGRVAAGHPLERTPGRGEAVRIFTGAPLPPGLDTVVMQEDCREEADHVIIAAGRLPCGHVRRRGEYLSKGGVAVPAGVALRPQELGLSAAAGYAEISVHARVRAAVFSTGDEIRDPGAALPAGCVFDANRFAIIGLLEGMGCEVTDLGILPDRREEIRDALAAAARDHHVIVTSGGVSEGEEDHVRAAVLALGRLDFWRLAIKPGKPVAVGVVGEARFFGLPGNPVAAMITFLRIARPVVLKMAGRRSVMPSLFRVRSGFSLSRKTGRREWLRVRLAGGPEGPVAFRVGSEGTGALTSMVEADGLVELPEDLAAVGEGDTLDVLPFTEVMR